MCAFWTGWPCRRGRNLSRTIPCGWTRNQPSLTAYDGSQAWPGAATDASRASPTRGPPLFVQRASCPWLAWHAEGRLCCFAPAGYANAGLSSRLPGAIVISDQFIFRLLDAYTGSYLLSPFRVVIRSRPRSRAKPWASRALTSSTAVPGQQASTDTIRIPLGVHLPPFASAAHTNCGAGQSAVDPGSSRFVQ